MNQDTLNIRASSLHRFICNAFLTTGMSLEDATTGADVLATADASGISTHGVKLLPGYLKRLKAGGIRPEGKPHVISEGPAWAMVDGDAALGAVIGVYAMRIAIAKAASSGIAYVGVRNGTHFSAIGYYPLLAAREGLLGICAANDVPSVVAPGALSAVLGTNPLSYAIPAGKHPPILLDMATSTVAGGKVLQAIQLGKSIPDSWLISTEGLPTTDPSLYPDHAALLPLGGAQGGYKGFGIGLLVEALAALLSGAAMTWGIRSWIFYGPDQPTEHGAGFIAIDPAVWGPREAFLDRVDALIDEIHAVPTRPGIERIVLPGEREFERKRRAQVEPLVLSPDVAENLLLAAEMAGLEPDTYIEA